MAFNYKQGYFKPKHPDKYVGDLNKIIYRSSWELEMDKFLDNNPNVIKWGSETIAIKYLKPTDGKIHRYFPDYFVEYINKKGEIIREILEVKPLQQTKPPRAGNLYEQLTYIVNIAKWSEAQKWCKQHGVKFRLVSEKSIFK